MSDVEPQIYFDAAYTLEELEAEVSRLEVALGHAKAAVLAFRLADAKYHPSDIVAAMRQVPGHRYDEKVLWTGQITAVFPPRWEGQPIRYRIRWLMRNGKWSKPDAVLESEIEGLQP